MGGRQSQHAPRGQDEITINRNTKIAIIGAGPAGVHMGHLLKKRGFTNVTILEQNSEVGGKSVTKFLKETGEDVPHEMGTVFMHPGYHRVKALANIYGISIIANDTDKKCDIWSPKFQERIGLPTDKPMTLMDFMFSEIKEMTHPRDRLPKQLEMITVFVSVVRYIRLHRRLLGKYEYTLPPCPSDESLESMDMTFATFLEVNNLQTLIPLLALGHTAQGYGFLNTIPAFYGLWWNSPDFLLGLLKRQSLAQLLRPGFQTLWKTIATQDKLNIIFNAKVISINRNLDARDKPIQMEVVVDEKPQTMEFDFLISTLPMPNGIKIFQDATPEETEVFSALKASTLATTIYQAKVIREDERGIQFYPEKQTPEFEGRFYSERISNKALYNDQPKSSTHVSVAYQYMSDYQPGREQQTRETIQKDLEDMGYTDVKIFEHKVFEYFPKFSREHIKKKYPWKIVEMQGKNRTWFAGSSSCFESAEDVVSYNHLLLRLFQLEKFCPVVPPEEAA